MPTGAAKESRNDRAAERTTGERGRLWWFQGQGAGLGAQGQHEVERPTDDAAKGEETREAWEACFIQRPPLVPVLSKLARSWFTAGTQQRLGQQRRVGHDPASVSRPSPSARSKFLLRQQLWEPSVVGLSSVGQGNVKLIASRLPLVSGVWAGRGGLGGGDHHSVPVLVYLEHVS